MPDADAATALCTFCPNLCRHQCPVSTAEPRETLIPRAKMASLGRLRSGALETSRDSSAALYGCTGCGACTEACRHHVEPARHLFSGRARAVEQGVQPAGLADLPARVRTHGERAAAAMRRGLPASRLRRRGHTALLAACTQPDQAAVALVLFDRVAASSGRRDGQDLVLADVSIACGGYPLLAAGHEQAFAAHARALASELSGFTRVAVTCPACAFTMQTDFAARGARLVPEVVHLAELLAATADRVPVTRRLGAAFYHDPCYLGRRSGIYQAPRDLLARALDEVREFSRSRAEAACCGGGGVLPLTMPETAVAIADARLAEVVESDLRTVVTACPTCTRRLARPGLDVRHLVDVLEEATRPPPG